MLIFSVGIEVGRVGLFVVRLRRGFIFSTVYTSGACCTVRFTTASTPTTGWESLATTSRA